MVKVMCIQAVINESGERSVSETEVKRFDSINRATDFLQENAIELIQDGWTYDYHISRQCKPGQKMDWKEWQKDMYGSRFEMFYRLMN